MMSYNPFLLLPLGLALLAAGAFLGAAAVRAGRTRRSAARRIVEKPNSHYTSPLVRNTELRHRWHDMALDRMHEINREEVVRLLAKMEATSVDALHEKERAFLAYMADLAGSRSDPAPPTRTATP